MRLHGLYARRSQQIMFREHQVLEALPVAVYVTDAEGRIAFYNSAAAEMWGRHPAAGTRWCGSWRLFWPDGRPMAHEECPMAQSLKEGRPVGGRSAILERPDGTRVSFQPYPSLLRDAAGNITGAVSLMLDIGAQDEAELHAARLAAIVQSSDDAIISKDLDGRITSWNAAATRIYGYRAEEMIGESIRRLIPPELQAEEDEILARLRRGERIDHFETQRVGKDGRRIDISVTVSPLHNKAGDVIGASKVARDITAQKQAESLQRLLFEELNHRVKNTLATIQAIANQSLRRSPSPTDFVLSFGGRIHALARAHDLLVKNEMKGSDIVDVIREQVLLGPVPDPRIRFSGPSVTLDSRAGVHLALVLHELATNARKYGALSVPAGRLAIDWRVEATGPDLLICWREEGVPHVAAPAAHGFGTTLIERTLESNGGEASIRYEVGGVVCRMRLRSPATINRASAKPRPCGSRPAPARHPGLPLLPASASCSSRTSRSSRWTSRRCSVVRAVGLPPAWRASPRQGKRSTASSATRRCSTPISAAMRSTSSPRRWPGRAFPSPSPPAMGPRLCLRRSAARRSSASRSKRSRCSAFSRVSWPAIPRRWFR